MTRTIVVSVPVKMICILFYLCLSSREISRSDQLISPFNLHPPSLHKWAQDRSGSHAVRLAIDFLLIACTLTQSANCQFSSRGSKILMEHPGTRGRIFYFARFYWTNHPRDSGTLIYKVIMMSFYQQRRCLPPRDDWQVSQTQFRGACSSSTQARC